MFLGQSDHFHRTVGRAFLPDECVVVGDGFLAHFQHLGHFVFVYTPAFGQQAEHLV